LVVFTKVLRYINLYYLGTVKVFMKLTKVLREGGHREPGVCQGLITALCDLNHISSLFVQLGTGGPIFPTNGLASGGRRAYYKHMDNALRMTEMTNYHELLMQAIYTTCLDMHVTAGASMRNDYARRMQPEFANDVSFDYALERTHVGHAGGMKKGPTFPKIPVALCY